MKIRNAFLLIVLVFSSHAAMAQCSGCLDTTFGDNGFVLASVNSNTAAGWATAVAIQPTDGKIVITAESSNIENTSAKDFYVLRFDTNGYLDPTFGNGGVVRFAFSPDADNESAQAIAIQPDGKILVAGPVQATSNAGMARLNPDGTFDPTFGSGGKLTFQVVKREGFWPVSIIVHNDGRIAVAGRSNNQSFGFARFNANGTFDTTFNGTGKLNISVASGSNSGGAQAMLLQPDGKYVATGSKGPTKGNAQTFMTMRVNSNGTLDTSFGSGGSVVTNFGGTWSVARNVAVDSAGRIVVGGDWLYNGQSWIFMRYLANGQLDQSFGSSGKVIFSSPDFRRMEGMAIQTADDKIVGSGWDRNQNTTDSNVLMIRINSDGSLDPTFGDGGVTSTNYGPSSDEGIAMAVQPDGKFVVGGIINGYGPTASIGLFRYLP